MRIALVCPRFHPFVGGVERCVKKLSEGFASRGHRVDVLTTDPTGNLPTVEQAGDVRVLRFRSPRNMDFYYPSWGLWRFLREHRYLYDVVHAHAYHAFPALCAALARAGTRLILTPYYHRVSGRWLRSALLSVYKPIGKCLIFDRVDIVVTISPWESRRLAGDFRIPQSKLRLIPCGAEVVAIRASHALQTEGKAILYVGRLERYKNLHLVIRALAGLPSDYRLYIAGGGVEERRLRRLAAELRVHERVAFLGTVTDADLYRWYRTCNVVVNVSELEAFGLTVLEALAAGKVAVVNSRSGAASLAEWFPEHVRCVDVKGHAGIEQLAVAMKDAQSPMTEGDVTRFTWSAVVDEHLRLYADHGQP